MKTSAEKNSTTTQQKQPATSFLPKQGEGAFLPPVQTKLQVNTPGDAFEQEADAVAEKVMSMPPAKEPVAEKPVVEKPKEEPKKKEVMRACADCAAKEDPSTGDNAVKRKETAELKQEPAGETNTVRRKETGAANTATPQVERALAGNGQRMDRSVQHDMEQRFGRDFSDVRVHTDSQAAASAQSIQAKAYTLGNHIVFGPGEYAPESEDGKKLLAHELVHVTQQSGTVRRKQNGAAPAGGGGSQSGGQAQSPAAPTSGGTQTTAAPPPTPTPAALREPIVPEAPEELTPAAQARLNQAENQAEGAAEAQSTLPSDAEQTAEARAGVQEPTEETDARASGALVGVLGQRPEPSPEIVELCENIRRVIREKRPPDEDSLLQANPESAANEAGTQLNDNVQGDADRVGGEYNDINTPASGTPAQNAQPISTPDADGGGPRINAAQATPDALGEEDVSLEADVERSQQQMDDAGMTSEPAQLVETGPIADARGAKGELDTAAAEDPALVLAEQDASLSSARNNLLDLQASAAQALLASRTRTVRDSSGQQTTMVGDEESQRRAVATEAERIFNDAQTQVNDLLRPLTTTAMEMWNTGKTRLATEFRQHLDRVQRWVDERHEGMSGAVVEVWDDWTGLPSWVIDEYDDAERSFGDGVCDLILEISTYVNGIILACEELIDGADRDISDLYASQPTELAEWAAAEQARFAERLTGLRTQVTDTRDNFNRELARNAAQAVQEVREQVHALREKAKGILGRLADAIDAFLEDPAKAIIDGLLALVGIDPAAFWALVNRISEVIDQIANDPVSFAQNLMSAIGAGFSQFFDRIGEHLLGGLLDWLFSGLGAVGVQIPQDMSISSIITFFLQLMGITWERVRRLLATHIGEENVQLLEQAFHLIADMIALGPAGIYEMIKEQLDPRNILDTIIQMAVDALRDALITQVAARILMLFNPVGAIAQAIEAIYRVLSWIFNNAARIFSLVETVVGGIADILAGNIGGMATAVENALARLISPVIDFLAGYAGLGNLPERIADAVRGLQTWVEGILNKVIKWLADKAKALLKKLGLHDDDDKEGGPLEDSEVGKKVPFSAGGESHRIWINTGASPDVMVASDNPMSVSQRLSAWEGRIGELTDDKKAEARGLIGQVRTQYTQTKDEALQAKQAIDAAKQNPTDQQAVTKAGQEDNQVEAAEQQMTPALGQLFDIFEGGIPFKSVQKTVTLDGGSESLSVDAGANGHPEAKIGGTAVLQKLVTISTGPMANAQHNHGRQLAQSIATQAESKITALNAITITNGKIPSASEAVVQSNAQELATILEGFRATKAASFQQLSTLPPRDIDKETVRFNQGLGNSQVILDEYDRQLRLQQQGMNRQSVDTWIVNRNTYSLDDARFQTLDAEQRRVVLNALVQRATQAEQNATTKKTQYQAAIAEIQAAAQPANLQNPGYKPNFGVIDLVTGRFGNEGSWRELHIDGILSVLDELRSKYTNWSEVYKRSAVLHNADQIAGGFGEIPPIPSVPQPAAGQDDTAWKAYLAQLEPYVGSGRVNSSIGSLWKNNIAGLDSSIRGKYPPPGWAVWKMNVELTR